ncbi:unnamed protein product [Mytilus coruscus]|uniref:Reverse transcriptase RNase H-like domain-containing protein n=1 Tax=Mytilus coruscus TaxID=42192 RepID=A0A6J7ZVV6_MYTCO|nr:unnamed protein product [Mytilus coruscus]
MKTLNEEEQVHALRRKTQNQRTNRNEGYAKKGPSRRDHEKRESNSSFSCGKCGTTHERRNCPAYGKKCHKCKKANHYQKFCKSKFSKSVHGLDEYSSCESDGENYFVGAVNRKTEIKENACFTSFKLQGKTVQFKIDTGAQVNILPLSIYKKLSNVKLSKTSTSLTSYSGDKLKVVGKCSLHLKDKNCEFFVTDTNQSPLLGFKASHELGLIHVIMTVQTDVDDPVKSFPKVFTGLGCLEKPYHIKIDSSVNPVINPPRKIPAPLREKLKITLKEMEDKRNIITKNPVLSFYDVSKPVTVSCDASQCGLGAMLIQDNKPVAYASRSLTDAESRYANIERELLGVLFGLERFNDYTYGKHINVESDHKPLEMIVISRVVLRHDYRGCY